MTSTAAGRQYGEILYEVDDPVATITLNRPEVLNAMTAQTIVELRHAVSRAARDQAVVGIVLTGAGRGFCAGADMKGLVSLVAGEPFADGDLAAELAATPGDAGAGTDFRGQFTYLMAVPKPVIAAINGVVAGMAVPLVLACDLRFMAEDAVLTTSFAQRGLIAEWGTSWLLPRLVGPGTALDLLWSPRRVTGREAAQIGFANLALPAAEALPYARRYIVDLAERCSPTSLAFIKRQVYEQLHRGLGAAENQACELMRESFERADFAEGVASFRERRPPKFDRL